MISEKLNLDGIDKKIITLLQDDPNITHTEIARVINRSQPTVGMRIKKLEKSGMFQIQAGVNLKNIELYAAKVNIYTENPKKIMNIAEICPFMINCFKTSGIYNIILLMASDKLENLDALINNHFRSKNNSERVKMELIINVAKDFILPIDFITQDGHDPTNSENCGENCASCKEFIN